MITVTHTQSASGPVVELAGVIEEQTQFAQQIGPLTGPVTFNLKGIIRINSVGVKAWIAYFQSLTAGGVQVTFEDCSPAIVDQLNMITNFTGGGKVKTVLLPFSCSLCGKEFVGSAEVEALRASGKQIPEYKCEKADCAAVFDDEIDYLYFIK